MLEPVRIYQSATRLARIPASESALSVRGLVPTFEPELHRIRWQDVVIRRNPANYITSLC